MSVVDISGKLVFNNNTFWSLDDEKLFDLSSLSKGVYYLHCKSTNGNTIQKIMIQ